MSWLSVRIVIAVCAPLVFVLAIPATAYGQMAVVSGTVSDAESGESLSQGTVRVLGQNYGTVTDANGRYSFQVPAGTVVIAASFVGYDTAQRTVRVQPDAVQIVDFSLRSGTVVGGEVIVEGLSNLRDDAQVGLQRVPIELVQAIPTAFEADLFRALQLLPGVTGASDFSSQLYVRGGSPDQTLILLDRATIYNPSHFFGFFSTFNTDAIDDVSLWKGAYPVEYGGRLGSVVDVSNREGDDERRGMIAVGLLASRVGYEGPVLIGNTPGRFMLAARRSTLEPLLSVLKSQLDEEGIPDSFHFYDLNARLTLALSDRDRLSISGYAGQDRVNVPLTDASFRLDYGNRMAAVAYSRIFSPELFLSIRGTASRYFNYPVGEVAATTFSRNNTLTDYGLRADMAWQAQPGVEITGGVDGGVIDLNLIDTFDGQQNLTSEITAAYVAAYSEAAWSPGRGYTLTGGVRASYFSTGPYFRVSPRLQLERALGDNVLLQVAAGRYTQPLALISNEAFSGFDVWVTAGPGVVPSFGDQVVLGVKSRPFPGIRADVELYARSMRDLFEINPNLQDVSGLDYADVFRFGEGYAAGAEFFVERGIGRLRGLVSYTLGVTRRRFEAGPSYPGSDPDPATGEPRFYPPKYDRLHDLSVLGRYRLGRGWSFTSTFNYATGQAYTEPQGRGVLDSYPFTDRRNNFLDTSRLNASRLPSYHRLDAGFTREGRFFNLGEYELQLQVVNVYNRRNLWFYRFNFQENPVERIAVRQLPVLPNISLRIDF